MFSGMLKSDDVEVYEIGSEGNRISLSDNCKGLILIQGASYTTQLELPNTAFIGKEVTIALISGTNGTGKTISNAAINITHSFNVVYTLKQGSITFKYVGQALNGLTATDKAKSGWIILGGVQGDTAITGYSRSVAIGSGAYCSDISSVAIGSAARTTILNSVSIGYNALSEGYYNVAIGSETTAKYEDSVAIGRLAYSNSSKIALKANSMFSANGDAQAGKFILMRQTTDTTPTVLTATNGATTATNILILPNNGTYAFKGIVVAKDASTSDSAMWEVATLIKRGANASTTAIVGTPTITKVFSDAGASAWTIALTADTTNGGGAITVTGEAGKTIRWVSNIDSAEVI